MVDKFNVKVGMWSIVQVGVSFWRVYMSHGWKPEPERPNQLCTAEMLVIPPTKRQPVHDSSSSSKCHACRNANVTVSYKCDGTVWIKALLVPKWTKKKIFKLPFVAQQNTRCTMPGVPGPVPLPCMWYIPFLWSLDTVHSYVAYFFLQFL